jgi:peroxiredoxin
MPYCLPSLFDHCYKNQDTMTLTQLNDELELFTDFATKAKMKVLEHTKGKKVIIVGLPGAFTPT